MSRTYLSEDSRPLRVEKERNGLKFKNEQGGTVYIVKMPFASFEESQTDEFLSRIEELKIFSQNLAEDDILTVLSTTPTSYNIIDKISTSLKYQLVFALKLETKEEREGSLDNHHIALTVFSKSTKALVHTKTRIGYTFCPFCDRTTKDYGGKKHLYHHFGTLMSDVWRDYSYSRKTEKELLNRLSHIFGREPYKQLVPINFHFDFPNVETEITPEFTTSENTSPRNFSQIINSDCLDALKSIPNNSIDYVFADPPYNLDKKYESWNDDLNIQDYFEWCDKWLLELARVVKPGGSVSILNIPLWTIRHIECLSKVLNFQDWIVWEGLSVPVRMIMPSNYSIITFSKGKSRTLPGTLRKEDPHLQTLKEGYCIRQGCINKRKKEGHMDKEFISNLWYDIHRVKHNSRRVDHPCQLPPSLMSRLISLYTNPGEWVLDPFDGVGTTSLVAHQLDRKYIGIELSEYYADINRTRHDEVNSNIDPFRKNDQTPKSKNSSRKRVKKQKYSVSKKELQLYIRELSSSLGRIPNREDVLAKSKYPIEYFDEYFVNWAEVTAAARTTGMTEFRD